jgi:hypothetical protein
VLGASVDRRKEEGNEQEGGGGGKATVFPFSRRCCPFYCRSRHRRRAVDCGSRRQRRPAQSERDSRPFIASASERAAVFHALPFSLSSRLVSSQRPLSPSKRETTVQNHSFPRLSLSLPLLPSSLVNSSPSALISSVVAMEYPISSRPPSCGQAIDSPSSATPDKSASSGASPSRGGGVTGVGGGAGGLRQFSFFSLV